MLSIVGANGQMFPPFWTKGTTSSTQYKSLLVHKVFPALDKAYGIGNCCWTQDGAPCHTSNSTQKYIKYKLGSKGFWSKYIWPPNSPNLGLLFVEHCGEEGLWYRPCQHGCSEDLSDQEVACHPPRLLSSLSVISSAHVLRPVLLLREANFKRTAKGAAKLNIIAVQKVPEI